MEEAEEQGGGGAEEAEGEAGQEKGDQGSNTSNILNASYATLNYHYAIRRLVLQDFFLMSPLLAEPPQGGYKNNCNVTILALCLNDSLKSLHSIIF